MLTMLPATSPQAGLPMSLMLHGLHGNARYAAPTGLLTQLRSDVARHAVAAFGFVAVDGGDDYWHENNAGDNPMAMLLDEVPRWLRERAPGGTDGLPFACAGPSWGVSAPCSTPVAASSAGNPRTPWRRSRPR
jgi:hypothetical protein